MSDVSAPLHPELRILADESAEANATWGANCGPHSIAAASGRTLAEVRMHIPNFRGWMNPTQVGETLRNLRCSYVLTKGLKTVALCNGVNRVQWEGPWLNPGVPPAAAYHHTHWVAHFGDWVLCTIVCPWAWVHVSEWKKHNEQRGDRWHITHHYELRTSAPRR